jgi:anti-sigma factor RsiW
MRELRAQNRVCERAREYSSRRLDDELSDFERALLESHLERCEPCRLYSSELEEIVSRLRNAPLEQLPHPIALPSRSRVRARALQVGVAAAAAVVAVSATLVGVSQSKRPSGRPAVNTAAIVADKQDVQQLHQIIAAVNAPDIDRIWSLSLKGGQRPT